MILQRAPLVMQYRARSPGFVASSPRVNTRRREFPYSSRLPKQLSASSTFPSNGVVPISGSFEVPLEMPSDHKNTAEKGFIPLAEAARIVYQNVIGRAPTEPAVLEKLAMSIGKHAAVFAHIGWGPNLERVRPEFFEGAEFMDGLDMMRSRNVPHTGLCIQERDLPGVISRLAPIIKP
jgi:hypothetical protein